jgi:hypothetical protein
VIGAAADAIEPHAGSDSLRFAMSLLLVSLILALAAVRMGIRHARSDFARIAS